jgi:hypothetical protein
MVRGIGNFHRKWDRTHKGGFMARAKTAVCIDEHSVAELDRNVKMLSLQFSCKGGKHYG